MGLADKLADIIRPRPAGLFSGPAPASTTTPGLSAASILSGAASEIAREGVRAFMRALETVRDPEVASHLDIPADDTPPAAPAPAGSARRGTAGCWCPSGGSAASGTGPARGPAAPRARAWSPAPRPASVCVSSRTARRPKPRPGSSKPARAARASTRPSMRRPCRSTRRSRTTPPPPMPAAPAPSPAASNPAMSGGWSRTDLATATSDPRDVPAFLRRRGEQDGYVR
mgnify:CR=1 FL=1